MWFIIIGLLTIGLVLIIAEVVFIPGTTVVGILGVVFCVTGIVITYLHFGNEPGRYVLFASLIITAVALFYSFRSGAWSKFALNSSANSRVNEGVTASLVVGEEGVTQSALRPAGTAEFNNKRYEVRTLGAFVESGQKSEDY